jgi:type I restriction enzyme S subunit
MPDGWRELSFDECVLARAAARLPSIPQSEYLAEGSFPVIDQGAGKVGGFTNAEAVVHRTDLPLIVFGDHTRVVKFADFPFATGADGTKLIRPNDSVVDPRFFYFALRSVRIPSKGYNRHFSKLREQSFAVPIDLGEQRRTASLLGDLERRCEIEESRLEGLRHLKAATMAKLFREGLRGEPQLETQIGLVPHTWAPRRLAELAHLLSGGTPSKVRTDWWSGAIPWLSPKDMKRTWIGDTDDHVTEEAARSGSRIVGANTVFVVIRGMILAKDVPVCIATVPMAFNQDVKAIVPKPGVDPLCLLYAVQASKQRLAGEIGTSAHGTRRLGSSSLESLLVPWPADANEAEEVGQAVRRLDEAVDAAGRRLSTLHEFFAAALQELMTGRVRVGAPANA